MKQDLNETLPVPAGITVEVSDNTVHIKGPKGEVSRRFVIPRVAVELKAGNIVLSAKRATKREKAKLYSTLAHLKNMIRGVQSPFVYILKVCSGHFPMNISFANNKLAVKNFLGEKIPRVTVIPQGTALKIEADRITVSSCDPELAGRTASNIEQLTRISLRDKRIFQDGIFITEKAGAI